MDVRRQISVHPGVLGNSSLSPAAMPNCTGQMSISVPGHVERSLYEYKQKPHSLEQGFCLQGLCSGISSSRSCGSTDLRRHVHQRTAENRTAFHLFRLQSPEQWCNRRAHRHRLGLGSPLADLTTNTVLVQVVLRLIPQVGVLFRLLQRTAETTDPGTGGVGC